MSRSRHLEVFLRKGVLEICSKFTGEHPCQSSISIKLLRHECSPVNLLDIFRTPFQQNTPGRLLLDEAFGALLTDLSKTFDWVTQSYGIPFSSLKLLIHCLTSWKQQTKAESSCRFREANVHGVSQGLILGPRFFNIFLCDIFLVLDKTYFISYEDDNTP